MSKPRVVSPPELVQTPDGRKGIKLYLCDACVKVLREKERENGARLTTVDVAWLCESCRRGGKPS